VHRSSESFAALAAALAKAQAQLVNPEKSLTATIRTGRAGETERTFRYAPLSSGLEIVRKTLSEHEIAVIQTTAIDQASRMLNLTTLLAHSSGEWIASYRPVCAIAEIATPHRMGAALTYARRYALFTLVGIAGEDDLDAPDICAPVPATGSPVIGAQLSSRMRGNGKVRGAEKAVSATILSIEESAALRDRMLSEIAGSRRTPSYWRTRSSRNSEFLAKPGEPPAADSSPASAPVSPDIGTGTLPTTISPRDRQERAYGECASSLPQQGASSVRHPAAVPPVRPQAIGSASHQIRAATCAWP
jgi:hypothetical protein